jgi:hypothetical protein
MNSVQSGDHLDLVSPQPERGYYRVKAPSGGEGYVWHRNVVPVETTAPTDPGLAHSRAAPVNKPFDGCGPAGSGGDTATDILKNRIDIPADYKPVDLATIVQLPVPTGLSKARTQWTAAQKAEIAKSEGTPIQAEGYEHVEHAKRRRGHDEEVDRDKIGDVIFEEGPPGLRGRFRTTRH